jgi:molecular chaperone DnaK (HSP70)
MSNGGSRAIGLDFGTSTTLIAERRKAGPATIVPIGKATADMPSVAAYDRGQLVTGEDADVMPADHVIRSVKQHITEGRETLLVKIDGESHEIKVADVVRGIISEAAARATTQGTKLARATDLRLGCPAMWTGTERRTLLQIAADAGLSVTAPQLIDEPIAAGISWVWNRFLRRKDHVDGPVLVFDYGGGTLDIAVLDVYFANTEPEITVLSALGVGQAGDLLDAAILADLEADWKERGARIDDLDHPALARALALRAARTAKTALSTRRDVKITVGHPYSQLPSIGYSRERLESLFEPQLAGALDLTWAALRAARLRQEGGADPRKLVRLTGDALAGDIKYVLLAGGMSQIPVVQRRLQEMFPKAEVETDLSLDSPAESVAAGLAFTSAYERLNLHRPGFDFVLEWSNRTGPKHQHTLYQAHTPLYTAYQVLSGHGHLGLPMDTRNLPCRGNAHGRIKVVALDGTQMPLLIDTKRADDIPVTFSDRVPLVVKLYVDGRLLIREGNGNERMLRVEQWPILQSGTAKPLVLSHVRDTSHPDDPIAVHAADWRDPRNK